jgi:acyl-CoA thioester hydrolase
MTDQQSHSFEIDMEVRDYEVDMEGIVNNAVYLNYLEHARHRFLKSAGIDFAELARRGINPVVVRSEVDYKMALRSGDRFRVLVGLERVSKLRIAFVQEIYRLSDDPAEADRTQPDPKSLAIRARIIGVVVSATGRPILPEKMHPRFAELLG